MIKVGYVPHSRDLQHPGDRRRLASWAADKETALNVANPTDSDVLVLSNAANFNYWLERAKQPVILDLVDGYLGEHPNLARDFGRNIVRSLRGTSNFRWIKYTNHLKAACSKSDAVIVASIEQKIIVSEFNKNVHVILDDHSELDIFGQVEVPSVQPHLFWEGFGYTLKHFQPISESLDRFLSDSGWGMYILTIEEFPRWGGYIGKVNARSLIENWFPLSSRAIEIIPWSIENVIKYAHASSIGIIPVDVTDKFAALKSENKLLSMWHLGLPTLFSAISSYSRVASDSHQEQACIANGDWYVALKNLSSFTVEREELTRLGRTYINVHHTHKQLVEKWDTVLNGVLPKNRI
jgi:hypothetical protein